MLSMNYHIPQFMWMKLFIHTYYRCVFNIIAISKGGSTCAAVKNYKVLYYVLRGLLWTTKSVSWQTDTSMIVTGTAVDYELRNYYVSYCIFILFGERRIDICSLVKMYRYSTYQIIDIKVCLYMGKIQWVRNTNTKNASANTNEGIFGWNNDIQ